MTYTYEIQSSAYLETLIDSLRNELNLKQGKIMYFSYEDDEEVEETLPIDELKDKVMEVFFEQDFLSISFPDVEINLNEDIIEIESEVKLALKGIDRDEIISDDLKQETNLELNFNNFKFNEIIW